MRIALWPDEPETALRSQAASLLGDSRADLLNLIACNEAGEPAGFAEASIRRDYVNGCETTPVVFLEGIYVEPAHRRRGVARALCAAVEGWGRAAGVKEFASDALLDNQESHRMHRALGFEETERVVYFRKRL
jgi:aminoglycoside 6'-N-acetyltransferase I